MFLIIVCCCCCVASFTTTTFYITFSGPSSQRVGREGFTLIFGNLAKLDLPTQPALWIHRVWGVLLRSRTTAFTLCFSHRGSCCGCSNPSVIGEQIVTPLFRGKTTCYRTLLRIDLNLIFMTIIIYDPNLRIFSSSRYYDEESYDRSLFMINELQNKKACKLAHMLLILCS